MEETRDVRALTEAAERVAGSGDFASAASLLRQAAEVQEATLGPTHPDLANTLNNLGVVYERIEQPVEAERCYRCAYAIASAVLPPEHPFVEMSARNLREFCDARGIPFDTAPLAPPAPASALPSTANPPAGGDTATRTVPVAPAPVSPGAATAPRPSPPATHVTSQPAGSPAGASQKAEARPARDAETTVTAAVARPAGFTRQRALAAVVVLVAIAVTVVVLRTRGSAPADRPDTQATTPSASEAATDAAPPPAAEHGQAPPEAAPREPDARMAPPSSTSTPRSLSTPAPAGASTPKPTADDEANGTRVVEAHVCSSLQTGTHWRCTPPHAPVSSGAVYFYTRLSVSSPTNVEHRWFQGSRLHQTIPLRVPAVSSYRVYSQLRVTPARAGEWRVEVRNSNGTVLREARFTIAP